MFLPKRERIGTGTVLPGQQILHRQVDAAIRHELKARARFLLEAFRYKVKIDLFTRYSDGGFCR